MADPSDASAMALERSCSLTAVALSARRREGVRLVTGVNRAFSLSSALDYVYVPYPLTQQSWSRTTITCGVALQCSPSKERVLEYRLNELSTRELVALTLVEARVAMGWVVVNWPGLAPELQRVISDFDTMPEGLSGDEMLEPCHRPGAGQGTPGRPSFDGDVADGAYVVATVGRQAASDLGQNAVDNDTEA